LLPAKESALHNDQSAQELMAEIVAALVTPVRAADACSPITAVAVKRLPDVDFASICLSTAGTPGRVAAATNPLVLEADRLQHDLAQGPHLDVLTGSRAVRSTEIAKDARWPLYGPKVAACGIAAQTTLPLVTSGSLRACLNLYSLAPAMVGGPPALTDGFATHASIALGYAIQMQDLGEALERRKTIGQAIGIIMERYGIDADAAFAFLTRASQTANVKLRDVAVQVVATAEETRSGAEAARNGYTSAKSRAHPGKPRA
jgi:hypothetical protein